MGFLDRLKPQPRWKHSDPVVRLQAIPELDDAIVLATLAEHDPDADVRTAAIAKITDPVVLGRVVTSNTDEGIRDAAADRLLALALDNSNAEAATAAGLLSDVRRVSAIAKSAAADFVREVALANLTDERSLGAVARQAKVETTALAAAARLSSADEILATALNSEHKEVALLAFDRVVQAGLPGANVALLKTIEARAQQKAVARRARTMLQAIEDEENARRVAEEERRNQEASLCAAVERLTDLTDPDRIAADLARLGAAWEALASPDAAATQRFGAGADAARLHMDQRRNQIAAALEETRRRGEALASRELLCRRIETIEGGVDAADVVERLRSIEEEWAQLAPLAGYERDVEQLATRFAATAKSWRKRLARAAALEEARSALEALVAEAESLSTREGKDAAERWRALAREAREPAATLNDASRPASDLMDRLAAVGQAIEARETAAREAAAKAALDQAARLKQLVSRVRHAADAGTPTLREGERLLRDVTTALEHAGTGKTTKEIGDALAALRTLQDPIALRVKELRDLDEWRRFGNAQRQEELIATAETLVMSLKVDEEAGAASDLAAAAESLRELQSQWQKAADVPRQGAQQRWTRFKTATDFIRSRCEIHFAQLRQERSANLAARAALVAEAEELADSTEWGKTATRFQELQKAWEDTSPVPGDQARSLAQRFRAACNTFFTRRREDLSSRKVEWAENLARKEALCEQAEQLAESTDWDTTASALKKLQADWKATGPVQHAKSEAVWKRFRSAADKFFERFHKRHEVAAAAQLAEHEVIVVALENLVALEEIPDDLAAQVQSLRTAITNAPYVEGAGATALYERWTAALASLVSRSPAAFAGTDLDPVAMRERMDRLIAKVESLVKEEAPVAVTTGKSAAELLAERLRSALESNALRARPDEAKWRAAGKAVEEAQEAWRRLPWVPGNDTSALEARFKAACTRVMQQVKQHVGSSAAPDADFAEGDVGGVPVERNDRAAGAEGTLTASYRESVRRVTSARDSGFRQRRPGSEEKPMHRAFARSIGCLALLSVPATSLADIDMTGDWTYECHDDNEFLGPMINTYSDTIVQTGSDLQWGTGGSGTIDAGTGVFDALGPPMPPFYLQRTFEGTVSPDGNRFEGVCNSGSLLRGIRAGISVCGDAEREPGEECDHGATNGLDGCCDVDCTLIDPDEDSLCSDIDTCPDDYDPENANGCGGIPAFETTRLTVRYDRQLISFRGLLRGSSATYIEEVNDLVFRESTLADPYQHDFGDLVCTRRNARRLACESVDGTKKVKLATSTTGTKIVGKLLQVGDVPSFIEPPIIIEFSDQHGTRRSSTIEDCTRGC